MAHCLPQIIQRVVRCLAVLLAAVANSAAKQRINAAPGGWSNSASFWTVALNL